MQLVYYPDHRLRKICIKAPTQKKKERARIASKMWRIMKKKCGVGLAAPQVGLDIRMFTFLSNGENHVIWNPKIEWETGREEAIEGCLSLSRIKVTMKRATYSIMTGEGIDGMSLKYHGNSTDTRIWQHEIDHLEGKLIIDNMSLEETLSNEKAIGILVK